MDRKLFDNKSQCCGCGACKNVCGQNAIQMLPDREGFLYPQVDEQLCVGCGRCLKVCQIHSLHTRSTIQPLVYAAQNRDEEARAFSTSGGIFPILAVKTLQEEGAVYGAAYTEDFRVIHSRTTLPDGYKSFVGSKYVQSDTEDTFRLVKRDLDAGRKVLFCGTPCQIAGLSCFLGAATEREELLLCELICHGVPSPLMWKEHLRLIEQTRGSRVTAYRNRSKVEGWHGHNEHFFLENGRDEYRSKLSQNHKDLFYAHLTIRPSCYECPYTGFPRMADITLADFWGIELCMKDFDDNKGTSLVIVNTEKGARFFDAVRGQMRLRPSNLEDAFRDNHKRPAKKNLRRDSFWNDYWEHGYLYVLRKYSAYTLTGRAKRQIKAKLKGLSKRLGVYAAVHKITQRKYQRDTYR